MISPATLKKHKLDAESLKALFTAATPSEKIKQLTKLITDRNRDGIESCLKNHQTWAAVDLAYDAPLHQITPTLIKHIMDTSRTPKEMLSACKSWGIAADEMFCKSGQKDKEGNDILELNAPVLHEVRIPVARSYTTVRTAKIFNDRNLKPLFKYEPVIRTSEQRILNEIITNAVERMASVFGYSSTLRQVILQSNLYSDCMMFPLEPWYEEKQEGEDDKETVTMAGVRYITPHKSRYYYDMQHPLCSFNTDTGGTFGGYWAVSRWGDVKDNDLYWNTEKISYGRNWLDKEAPWANYFQQAYPCVLEFPTTTSVGKETNRETLANQYADTDYDKAIFLGYQFAKLVPKKWGLGDYKFPVWFRFITAGDDKIIWAEAFSYRPIIVSQYDADQTRGKNCSLALEIIPSQDLLGNLLTQTLLSIKRNLANILFYDTQQIDPGVVEDLSRKTHWQYQRMNLIGFDSFKDRVAHKDSREAIHEVKFAYADISAQLAALNTVISLLERLLVVSPQEIGSAASHQQSKAEVVIIAGNTTNRVAYTGSFIDDTTYAWMRQLYEALQAHGPDEIISEVSADIPDLEKHLKTLGFEITGKAADGKKVQVKGKKNALKLELFASRKAGPERNQDAQVVQAMYQAIASLNQNPAVAAAADPASILELLEQAAKLNGADEDFKIVVNKEGLKSAQLQQVVGEIEQMIMGRVEAEVAKPAAEAVNEQEQKISEQQKVLDGLMTVVDKLQQIVMAAQAAPPLPQPPPLQPLLPPIEPQPVIIPGAPAAFVEGIPVA